MCESVCVALELDKDEQKMISWNPFFFFFWSLSPRSKHRQAREGNNGLGERGLAMCDSQNRKMVREV